MSSNSVPVKPLVLGTAEIEGRPVDRKGFVGLVHSAIDAGITTFDTASNYQDGRAQRWLIEALIDYRESINPNFLLSEVANAKMALNFGSHCKYSIHMANER